MRGVGLRVQAEFLYVPQFREQDEPWLLAPEEPLGPAVQRALVYQAQQEVKALACTHGVCLRRSRPMPRCVRSIGSSRLRRRSTARGSSARSPHCRTRSTYGTRKGWTSTWSTAQTRCPPSQIPANIHTQEFGLRS